MTNFQRLFFSLLLSVFVFSTSSVAATTCQTQTVVSSFVSDVYYQDPEALVDSFRGTSFNTIATILAWSVIEKERGHVDMTMYYPQLDALTKAGYCLIVLIDTSGRAMRSDVAKMLVKDVTTIPLTSMPEWIGAFAPHAKAIDFFGTPSGMLDFEDTDSLSLVKDMYAAVLPDLRRRYGRNIVAVSPCITSECEVKYSQTGFRWLSYSPVSQKAFRAQLENWGIQSADLPMMNYGNHLSAGNPRTQQLYPYMQSFRENSLRNYVCSLTQIIRRVSLKSIGYFGETFTLADGIYASGVIEQTSDCFDIAAIDYNFYNGHGIEFKPEIPAFMTNYVLSLGYRQVLVGLYMERFRDAQTLKIDERGYRVLRESLERIHPDARISGVEIGNLTGKEFSRLGYVTQLAARMRRPSAAHTSNLKRVAIYASVANSYLWEGDWSNDRQLYQDNLIATYSELKSMPNLKIDILTDVQLSERPWTVDQYDLIVLPHVTAMPRAAHIALLRYAALGGKLLADMRPDEYFPDGSLQTDASLRNVLGIGAYQAFNAPIQVKDNGKLITLGKQKQYIDGFVLAPTGGFSVAFKKDGGHGEGLLVRGEKAATFGFLPLLVVGSAKSWARDQFINEVRRLTSPPSHASAKFKR